MIFAKHFLGPWMQFSPIRGCFFTNAGKGKYHRKRVVAEKIVSHAKGVGVAPAGGKEWFMF